MHVVAFWFAAIIFVCVLAAALELARGGRRLESLSDEPEAPSGSERISVVFAARDEARSVEATIRALLLQDYSPLEIIAVDDRSVDGTGAILDDLANGDSRLRVLHIRELPDGWLGKNHALQRGAAEASGGVILFTDADVVFAPTTVGRMVHAMARRGLDHLTVAPELEEPTLPLAVVVTYFLLWFVLWVRPWRAEHPGAREHLGIGAFNAVRAELCRSFGGHERIAMRPDDDIKLGKLVKISGGHQGVMNGQGLMRVRWYDSLPAMIRGLRKNAFSALEYRTWLAVVAVAGQLVVNVWPFVGVWMTSGPARWLYGATIVVLVGMYAAVASKGGSRPWLAMFYPGAALVFAYIIAAATARTLIVGGIDWRGTTYPLAALRRNTL